MVKMIRFLDRFEDELKILREEKKFIQSEQFLDTVKKGHDVYNLTIHEICGRLDLEGYSKTQQAIRRISRGYEQLINTVLKFSLKYFDQKSIYLDDQDIVLKKPKAVFDDERKRVVEDSIDGGQFYSRMAQQELIQQKMQHQFSQAVHSGSQSPANHPMRRYSMIQTQPNSPIHIHSQPNEQVSVQNTDNGGIQPSPFQINLIQPQTSRNRSQSSVDTYSPVHRQGSPQNNGDMLSLALPGAKYDMGSFKGMSYEVNQKNERGTMETIPDEEELKVQKEFEAVMKEKENIKQMSAAGTSSQLKQVLVNLSKTKKKGDMDLEPEEEEEDIEKVGVNLKELKSNILDIYAKGQRKTAQRVLTYAEKKGFEKLTLRKDQKSVGIDPDYKLIEEEKQQLLATKDEEYEKIIFTFKEERAKLKTKVEELTENFNNTTTQLLSLQSVQAKFDYEINTLQNEIRTLKSQNGDLNDKVERKKIKIKGLKEDLNSANAVTTNARAETARLVEENTKLLNNILELKVQVENFEKQTGKNSNQFSDLEEMMKAKERIIEEYEKELEEREETISELGRLLDELRNAKVKLNEELLKEKALVEELSAKLEQLRLVYEEEKRSRQRAEREHEETNTKVKELETNWEMEKAHGEDCIGDLNGRVQRRADPIAVHPLKIPLSQQESSDRGSNSPSTRKNRISVTTRNGVTSRRSLKSLLSPQTQNELAPEILMNKQESQRENSLIDINEAEHRANILPQSRSSSRNGLNRENIQIASDVLKLREESLKSLRGETNRTGRQTRSPMPKREDEDSFTQRQNSRSRLQSIRKSPFVQMIDKAVGTESTELVTIALQTEDLNIVFEEGSRDLGSSIQHTRDSPELLITENTEREESKEKAQNFDKEDQEFNELSRIRARVRELLNNGLKAEEILESLRLIRKKSSHSGLRSSKSLDKLHPKLGSRPSLEIAMSEERKRLSDIQYGNPIRNYNQSTSRSPSKTSNTLQAISITQQSTEITPQAKFERLRRPLINRSVDFTQKMAMISKTQASDDESADRKSEMLSQIGRLFPNHENKKYRSNVVDTLNSPLGLNTSYRFKTVVEGQNTPLVNKASKYYFPTVKHEITKAKRVFLETEADDEVLLDAKKQEEAVLNDMYEALQEKIKATPGLAKMFKSPARRLELTQESTMNNSSLGEEGNNNEGNNQVEFDEFKNYFVKFKSVHKKCGDDCVHLRRFYQKIGWVSPSLSNRPYFVLQRTDISKLPKVIPKQQVIHHYHS